MYIENNDNRAIKLIKKSWEDGDSWSSGTGGARWAFFAIFIILIIVIIFGTIRVNKKRSKRGVQPIYGTRWMTPPSYVQSQDQYGNTIHHGSGNGNANTNGNGNGRTDTYVPTYTAEATDYDMGYYDNNGVFHPNPNANANANSTNKNDPQFPQSVHHRTSNSVGGGGQPISSEIPRNQEGNIFNDELNHSDDELFRRPTGVPPQFNNNNANNTSDNNIGTMPGAFERPSSPPPGHQVGNSSRELESLPSFSETNQKTNLIDSKGK